MDAECPCQSSVNLSTLQEVGSYDDHSVFPLSPHHYQLVTPFIKKKEFSGLLVDLSQPDLIEAAIFARADNSFVRADEAEEDATCVIEGNDGNHYIDINESMSLITQENGSKLSDNDDPSECLIPKNSSTDSELSLERQLCTYLLRSGYNEPYIIRPSHRTHRSNQNYSSSVGLLNVAKCKSTFLLHWNWAAVRLGCFILLTFMIISAFCVVIRLVASGNKEASDLRREWWEGMVSYEIFPASFQDSDNDGYGDLMGLIQRLSYVQSLNVKSIRLNSIFSALDYPLEFSHVIDFLSVDPHLGRMEDFQLLVAELHRRGMRLILDINPSLTSDQHTWAAHWLQNSSGKYKYYYVNNETLNNLSEFDDEDKENPSLPFGSQLFLNWSHPAVQNEIDEVLKFWLQKGVDGFYMKGLRAMNSNNIYLVMKRWRHLLDAYSVDTDKKIMMVSEIFLKKLKDEENMNVRLILDVCDLIDVQLHLPLHRTSSVETQVLHVAEWNSISSSSWTHWHLGSVETSRLATRLDTRYTLSAMIVLLMLPGSISLFYGDEINLQDSIDIITGKTFSEGQLCPMQWDSTFEANFTHNMSLPWLPIRPDFMVNNVAQQSMNITLLGQVISVKQSSPSLWMKAFYDNGSVSGGKKMSTFVFHYIDDKVVVLERHLQDNKKYVLFAEFGKIRRTLNFLRYFASIKILFSTSNNSNISNLSQFSMIPGTVLITEVE
ncbi:amino acid transporter heavy chain SLC3A1-like [Tachypleus tridentatus]|uniref:amino acid transporter heavy chain SLC3A1-like n=1 Tax=Tachypleus tridentatus TaxID=6853 RepID=UPI003FD3F40D